MNIDVEPVGEVKTAKMLNLWMNSLSMVCQMVALSLSLSEVVVHAGILNLL